MRPHLDDDGSIQDQARLVSEMVAGSRGAWLAFHARYDRVIRRCIGRMAPRLGREDAREIHATLLVQLCANDMGKLRGFDASRGVKLGTWIGMLAGHCAVDHLRSQRREPLRAALEEADEIQADAPTPLDLLDRKERLATASAVLRELSVKDREFFALYFDEGLDVEQIAARMAVSVKTVYTKKHKIQSRIEARLAESAAEGDRLAA